MKIEIKHRWNLNILFTAEIADDTEPRFQMRAALEVAVKARANLAGAYLAGANLARANLADAYLADAYLAGANLAGANLARANLAGAKYDGPKPVDHETAIANLDKVREIILDNQDRLDMGVWHAKEGWQERSCAEEATCGTSHCLAGWLQVCATDPEVRKLEPQFAGFVQAPVAAKMFFRDGREVVEWLRDRAYVQDAI